MKDTPTPDTDAELKRMIEAYNVQMIPALFARKLERERDEARAVEKSAIAAMSEFQNERDQLRK